jgi:DNA polymerase-3 subunit gamma/tau
MEQALYRVWRPKTWDEVTGQDHVIQTLRNAVKGERVAHAYLFAGPRGTGKTTTARLLAKAVNCLAENPADRPCNHCSICEAINEGRFLDLIEIDAASNTSVDDVRDLREKINFSPNEGRFKVYIIDEVHMLSTAAFNALLKTLEEPPAHAIFILATTEVHKIPATVLSRCQRHEFRRLPVSTIIEYLSQMIGREKMEVDADAIEAIARQATGSLRDAISLLDQLTSTGERVTLEMAQAVLGTVAGEAVRLVAQAIVDHDVSAGLTLINDALDSGADPRQFARQVVAYLRGLLLVRMGNADLVDVSADDRRTMAKQAESLPTQLILAAIQAFGSAAAERTTSWQAGLPLEIAFVETVSVTSGELEKTNNPASSQTYSAKENETAAPKRVVKDAASSLTAKEYPPLPDGEISFQHVSDRWAEVLAVARRHDPRIQALLNSCRPLGIQTGTLVIGFRSDLLREKMEKGHNMALASQALQEVFNKPVGIRCILTEAWQPQSLDGQQPPPMESGGMVSTALRDLGAHVVDVQNLPPDSSS